MARPPRPRPQERPRPGAADPRAELRRAAGERGDREYRRLREAAAAFEAGRYRDARRLLGPLAGQFPAAASVRELHGLTLYRMGEYEKAVKELETFAAMAGTTEQHPVLMDCYRAQARWPDVERLWDELRDVSPAGDLVTEGRIVMAGALADQGRLGDGLRLLRRGPVEPKRPKPHHLRLWYALADLEERAGNLTAARTLFERIRRHDATFADVPERLGALS